MRLAVLLLLVAPVVAVLPADAEGCAPYPVGRCGAYDRESVVFCYLVEEGVMVDASDASATPLLEGGVVVAYVRTAPTQAFAADPMTADLPFGSAYQETNGVEGLQRERVTCATFEWWAECDSWMGPYNEARVEPDALVV